MKSASKSSCDPNLKELRAVKEPILHPNHFAQEQPVLFVLGQEQWQRVSRLNRQKRRRFSQGLPQPQLPLWAEK